MKNLIILGKSSFVGNALYSYISKIRPCSILSKEELNFLNTETFKKYDFNNSIIVDCINVNNGNDNEILECNIIGFSNFLDYLKLHFHNVHYIYVSTVSVLSEKAFLKSTYVQSKKKAEELLMQSGLEYQIMRLSYPVGIGENRQRLIPNLFAKLKSNQGIQLNDIKINLNSIDDVVKDMYAKFLKEKVYFISNNSYLPLVQVITKLKNQIGSNSIIEVISSKEEFCPISNHPFIPERDIYDVLSKLR